ncbi:MAG: hypothetical protein AAFQ24_13075 [Pseudomonadota bacterium]
MTVPPSSHSTTSQSKHLPQVSGRRLFASPPEKQADERRKSDKLTRYRRNYWQNYKDKIRRVFGTLSVTEYEFWQARAADSERTVWAEIYSAACAYIRGEAISPPEVRRAQEELRVELRRIGNNLNQAVKFGHIRARRDGHLVAPHSDEVGQAVLKAMTELEQRLIRFETDMRALTPSHNGMSFSDQCSHDH